MLSIARQFEWDMGHRLPNHESKCRNPHGHRYQMNVGISGELNETPGDSQQGMIVDFGPFKRLIVAEVVEPLDHSFMFYEGDEVMAAFAELNPDLKMNPVPFIPTAEAIVMSIATQIEEVCATEMPDVSLHHVQLFETPTSSALWTPDRA